MFRTTLAALALLPVLASAQTVHDCTTTDFLTADRDDAAFTEMNLQKTFTLTVDQGSVTVAFDVPDGRRITHDYAIVSRDEMTIIAVRPQMMNMDSLVLPAHPERRGPRFNATISLQGEFFVNAWILDCATP